MEVEVTSLKEVPGAQADTTEAFRQILYGLIVLALAWVYVRLTGQRGS